MDVAFIVANQVLIMFLLIAVGVLCDRIGMITPRGAKQMASLLLYLVSPSLIVTSYQRDYDPDKTELLLWCVGLAVVTHLVGIGFGKLLFRPNERRYPNHRDRIAFYGSMYSNAGFFAYPVLSAVFGSEGIFYGVAYTAVFLVFNWTHGVVLLTKKFSWRFLAKLLVNPAIISVALGLLLYFTGWRLPQPANDLLLYIGDLNTPLAMIVIGCWCSRVNWRQALRDWTLYLVSAVRLLFIPLVMLALYRLLAVNDTILIAALIPAASPAGANTSMMTAVFGGDQYYGSQIIAVSTLLCIVTLPAIVFLAGLL